MARTTGSFGEKTEASIREAAIGLIARHGYEAVTMRQLAAEVGVQAAALYRYFPTKEELLFTLLREHMENLLLSWKAARAQRASSLEQLVLFVDNHIRFHVARRASTHISNMELRSLSPERLTQILRLRALYEKELRQILREGNESGAFSMEDTNLTSIAIIQMITGVIVWFRPDERLSVEEVCATYLSMTKRLVGVRQPWEQGNVRPDAELRA